VKNRWERPNGGTGLCFVLWGPEVSLHRGVEPIILCAGICFGTGHTGVVVRRGCYTPHKVQLGSELEGEGVRSWGIPEQQA